MELGEVLAKTLTDPPQIVIVAIMVISAIIYLVRPFNLFDFISDDDLP